MEIRFTLTAKEFRDAYGLMLRNSTLRYKFHYWVYTWLGPAAGLIVTGCGLILIVAGNVDVPLVTIFLAFGVLGLSAPLRFRYGIRKQFRLANLDQEISVTVGGEGLVVKRMQRDAETRFGWSAMEKSLEVKELWVLLPNKVQFVPISKRAMTPEQQNEFRELMTAHIPNAAGQTVAVGR